MVASLLIITAIAGFVLYRRSIRPKQLESGEWQVVDHQDGTLRCVLAVIALLIGTQWAFGIVIAILEVLRKNPAPSLVGLLVVVGFYGWLLWVQGGKVYEALHAAPGELRLDNWPLAAGEHITLNYHRRLHRGIPAGELQAHLVHYEVKHGHFNGGHDRKRKRVVKQVRLEDGEAEFRGKELIASWRFQVPNPMGNPIESLQRLALDSFFNQHRDDEWWELQIQLPLRGGLVLDSSYKLDITFIEGRTQFHMGA